MDKFLETQCASKPNQEETDNLSTLHTRSKTDSAIFFKKSLHIKSMKGWLHWGILPNIKRRTYTNPYQALPKDRK